ncbi:MAG: autotransporter outer membrane beta-barrel domain-containing protein, partial [Pseudomonadota bacterium]
ADFTWTGLENDSAVVDSETNAFTVAGGVDAEVAPGVVFGAAVSVGRAFTDAQSGAVSANETSVAVTPYFAYRLTDQFSLQGLVGYGYGRGDVTLEQTDVTGDIDSHRYFVAVEGGYFESWGDASLFAGVGVLWGQSHQLRYTRSDGRSIGSERVDIGSANVVIQPSYLIALDDDGDVVVEPYALLDYSYDFDITKIDNATNDRDAFRVGGGANIYTRSGVSGAVEATRMLGREDQEETTARATLRFDF